MNDRGRQTSDAYHVVADGSVLAIEGNQKEVLAIKRGIHGACSGELSVFFAIS